ncbi:hypothetical protein D3C85_786700 [compost metagenome]
MHGDVGAVPHRHDPDAKRVVVDKWQEATQLWIVAAWSGAHPGDAGAREAQVGVFTVHGLGGVAVFTGKHHHRQGPALSLFAQALKGGAAGGKNEIEHGFNFGGRGEQAQRLAGLVVGYLR